MCLGSDTFVVGGGALEVGWWDDMKIILFTLPAEENSFLDWMGSSVETGT